MGSAAADRIFLDPNRYYLSADRSKDPGDVVLTGSRTVASGLAPNTTSWASVGVTLPLRIAAGSYYLIACADDAAVQAETNEDNNCRASGSPVAVSL